jgi:hypothetical protein
MTADQQNFAIRSLANHYRQTLPNGLFRLGDDRRYYTGKGNILQIINIQLNTMFSKRDDKLAYMQQLFGRVFESTKDLTFGEAVALRRVLCEMQRKEIA